MMAVQAQFNDNDYKNWIRTCLGLQFLKEGIVDYVDAAVQTLHRNILTNVCQSVTCNGCTTDDLTKRRRPCPKNVCDKIRDKLQNEHRYGQPEWNNTDATRWCTDHWEIAKGFMSKGYKMATSSADTDTAGLLSVCINGLFMPCAGKIIPPHRQPLMDSFHKNREARNAILHSGSMSISDADRQDYIHDMVTLLATYKQPVDLVTQDAIHKLRQLNGGIFITPTDELVALKARLEAIDSNQQDLESKVETVQQEQKIVTVDQHNIERKVDILQQDHEQVDTNQQNLESKVKVVQQEQQVLSDDQRELDSKVNVIQQELKQTDVNQQDLGRKMDTIQQDHERINIGQQALETKIDSIQQNQGQTEVNQQLIENKIDVMQQGHDRIDLCQQMLENKVIVLKEEHQQADAKHQIVEGKVYAMQQEQEQVGIKQQQIVSTVDALQQEQKRVDTKQHELERKFDTMQLEHEQADVKHELDIEAMETQSKKNGKTLAILKDKLVELQMNTEKDVSDIQNFHRILQEKNNKLNDNLTILSSCAKHQEFQIDEIKDQVKSQKDRIAHLEDAKSCQRFQIQQLMKQTGNQGARVDHLHDQVVHQEREMNNLSVQSEIHESRMDRLELKTGGEPSNMSLMLNLTSDQATQQESRISGLEDSTRNLETKVRVIEEQRLTTNEARTRLAESTSTDVSMKDIDKSMKDIQDYLLKLYKADLSTIPVAPLLQKIKANIDDIYTELIIRDDLVHTEKKQSSGVRDKVKSYQDVLNDGSKQCNNVFVVGKAGVGKTTWSRKLVSTWCGVMTKTDRNDISSLNDITLLDYDLVFYLELRHAKSDSHILAMIEHQLFPPETTMMSDVKALLETDKYSSRCLIVLDGLDEWVGRDQCTSKDGLPARDPRWKSSVITTTRSWKLEELQLESQKIDRAVEIIGIHEYGTRELVEKVVSALNIFSGKDKNAKEFDFQSHLSMRACMHIPLLLTIFVCLWYEEGQVDQSLAATYCGLVELLIKYAEGDAKKQLNKKVPTKMFANMTQTSNNETDWTPDCIAKKRLCQLHYPLLLKLGKIGFDQLFSKAKESSLVFDHQSIKDVINDDELEIALNIGILSKTAHRGSVLEQEFSLSFLHKTVQEFLAALHMVAQGIESNQCLITYKRYCESPHDVLEMENIIMFVSGLCPELAGEMSCHIADMERSETMNNMLLRCVKQECAASSQSRHIYIKHHFLYPTGGFPKQNNDGIDYTMETVKYIKSPTGKDTTLELSGELNDDVLRNISDIRHVKLTAAFFYLEGMGSFMLEFAQYMDTGRKCEQDGKTYLLMQLAAEYIEELDICWYRTRLVDVLDLTACKSLRVLRYDRCSVPIRLPKESLQYVKIVLFRSIYTTELDLSGCKLLRSLHYEQSTVPIRLPYESLECVEIVDYRPNDVIELDLSGCKALKILIYKHSTIPIRLPSKRLEDITLINYQPCDELELDLSKCHSLKKVCYRRSNVPIRLPLEQLEEVNITNYRPSHTLELDFSGCKFLRNVYYDGSVLPICLPSQHMEEIRIVLYEHIDETASHKSRSILITATYPSRSPTEKRHHPDYQNRIVHIGSQPGKETILDLSSCETLRTVQYEQSTVPIRLPSKCLEEVTISDYRPYHEVELDLSRCQSLRKVLYEGSIVPIMLPYENLKEISISDYGLMEEFRGYDFEPMSIAANYQFGSLTEKQLHADHQHAMVRIGCQQDQETMLDLSGCQTLRTVRYKQSSVPIRLPLRCLEEVHISYYRPHSEFELDISGCQSLRMVYYHGSAVPIRLPSERMKEICVSNFEQIEESSSHHPEPISITTYYQPGYPTEKRLQANDQDQMVRIGCPPDKETTFDLSGCQTLRIVKYEHCTVPIRLPSTPLEDVRIFDYRPHCGVELDMSGCQLLRMVHYRGFIVPIRLPSEYLETIRVSGFGQIEESSSHKSKPLSIIANYLVGSRTKKSGHQDTIIQIGCQPGKEAMLDLSGCESLRKDQIRLPSKCLEEVFVTECKVGEASTLDLSGCESLKTVHYEECTLAIQLPSKSLEKVHITDYRVGDGTKLDLSGCEALRSVRCTQCTVPIRLPSRCLEEVSIIDYRVDDASVLDLSGCESLRSLCYEKSTVPIRLPSRCLEKVSISDYMVDDESVLDLSGCEALRSVRCTQCTVPIRLPSRCLEEVSIIDYRVDDASVLDLSGCESLRSLCYEKSTVPIRLPSRCLEKVSISDYRLGDESVLDLSKCNSLRSVFYKQSTVAICLPSDCLEAVDIINYKPKKESILDLSSCKYLKTVNYRQCTSPIRLPNECLELVEIIDYNPHDESILDLSACQSIEALLFERLTVPVYLYPEDITYVAVIGYKTTGQSIPDMSACESHRTICYMGTTVPIQVPLESLEYVDIFACKWFYLCDQNSLNTIATQHLRHPTAPICIHLGHVESASRDSASLRKRLEKEKYRILNEFPFHTLEYCCFSFSLTSPYIP